MSTILVERVFGEPQVFQELQAREDAKAWCLEMHDVTFSHTYFATDRCRMVCVYHAPDAESVRLAQRKAELPFERVWRATEFSVMQSRSHDPALRLTLVQRTFPGAVSLERAREMMLDTAWCLETNAIRLVSTYFEDGGPRGLCVYAAPDLEAVRRANKLAKLPSDTIWPADLKIPAA